MPLKLNKNFKEIFEKYFHDTNKVIKWSSIRRFSNVAATWAEMFFFRQKTCGVICGSHMDTKFFGCKLLRLGYTWVKNFGHWTRSREDVVPYSSKNPQNRDFGLKWFFFHQKKSKFWSKIMKNLKRKFFKLISFQRFFPTKF